MEKKVFEHLQDLMDGFYNSAYDGFRNDDPHMKIFYFNLAILSLISIASFGEGCCLIDENVPYSSTKEIEADFRSRVVHMYKLIKSYENDDRYAFTLGCLNEMSVNTLDEEATDNYEHLISFLVKRNVVQANKEAESYIERGY